jgi:hypothetical protein
VARILTLMIIALTGSQLWAQVPASPLFPASPIIEARDCILQIVAGHKNITLLETVPLPEVKPEGPYTLQDYQDSAESFWGFRPDAFLNMYNSLRNEIFIMATRAYYDSHERSVFDSLAHELVHYLQHRYQNADFSQGDDSLEFDAIATQTWFRETYKDHFVGDVFVCPTAAVP